MGFGISIDESSDAILRNLRRNPTEVFGSPYSAFLLFLISGDNQAAIKWLEEIIKPLDSKSGSILAFAIFAKRYDFQIQISDPDPSRKPNRPPTSVGVFPAGVLPEGEKSVRRLVKQGKCGLVMSGDTISAMTYAVDEIATGFGVLNKMPCCILLDAVPFEPHVIELTSSIRADFLEIIEDAITEYTSHDGYLAVKRELETLIVARESETKAEIASETLQRKLEKAESKPGEARHRQVALDSLHKQAQAANSRKRESEQGRRLIEARFGSRELPRFSDVLLRVIAKRKLSKHIHKVASTAANFASEMVTPENLSKLIVWLATAWKHVAT